MSRGAAAAQLASLAPYGGVEPIQSVLIRRPGLAAPSQCPDQFSSIARVKSDGIDDGARRGERSPMCLAMRI
jgi:hypothetical protein